MADDLATSFKSFMTTFGKNLTASHVEDLKDKLHGHVDKSILAFVDTGPDLMFTLEKLKLVNPSKLSLLRTLCEGEGSRELRKQIDQYKFSQRSRNKGPIDEQKRQDILRTMTRRQTITYDEYKGRLERTVVKYKTIKRQKEDLLERIETTKSDLKNMQKEVAAASENMDALIKLRTEKENKKRIENIHLKKFVAERDEVLERIETINSDLLAKGKHRVNTFQRATLKSELRKCESTKDTRVVKVNRQEERVAAIDEEVKLFLLEQSEQRPVLREKELAVHLTTKALSELYDELHELNGELLLGGDELFARQDAFVKIESLLKLTMKDRNELVLDEEGLREKVDEKVINEILHGEPKNMNYDLLGMNSFSIEPVKCKKLVAFEIDQNGDILLADQTRKKLMLINLNGKTKQTISLDTLVPRGVTINSDGNYVVIGHRELRVYDSTNHHMLKKSLPYFVSEEMRMPHLISVSGNRENGELYLLDRSNNAIQVFSKDGTFLRVNFIGEYVACPCHISVINEDECVISDELTHSIKIFQIKKLSSHVEIGSPGYGYRELAYPSGVGTDYGGNLVVADQENHRIQVLTRYGDYVSMYGRFGMGEEQLDCPADVRVYESGAIVVLDLNNNRLVVYY